MIQILGLRQVYSEKLDSYKTVHSFYDKQWRAGSVPQLFQELPKIMGQIPQEDRWNLFYTTADCQETPGCRMVSQTTIPWDIDGIDLKRIDEYHPIVLNALGGLKFDEVGIVCSGNGLQYLVESDIAITAPDYFRLTKSLYDTVCGLINQALESEKLDGKTDPSVWSPARLMRLPGTVNKKTPETGYKNKNLIRDAYLIQKNIIVQPNFSLESLTNIPIMSPNEEISTQQLSRFPAPDTKAVLEGCAFLQHCHANPNQIDEPAWYAMLSITSRLDEGSDISHRYSSGYAKYSYRDTAIKIEHAKKHAGPRTCRNIDTLWGGCKGCKHYQRVVSPITIRSEDYIATQATGFYNINFNDKTGQVVKTKPNFDDLRKFFNLQYEYVTDDNSQIFIYNGKHWEILKDIHPQRFCEEHFDPKPTKAMASEFLAKIHRTNGRPDSFFNASTAGMINLQNGILDLSGAEAVLHPHNADKAFMYVAEYEYDPDARAPRFERFMEEVTMGDATMYKLLMEFIAYALTDVYCVEQKALILLGEGSNGKSTFIDLLKLISGGPTAYSILNLNQLADAQQAADLQGKLFNLCEETHSDSFMESSHFKNVVSGGELNVKVVYKPPFKIKNRAKLIVSANRMPKTKDNTHGMLRRLIIVPFDARFSGKAIDKELNLKLRNELPGILNLVIEAYYRYKSQRGLTEVTRAKKALDEYKNDSGLDEFFDDVIVQTESKDDFLGINTLYENYINHCKETYNNYPINNVHFGRALNAYLRDKYYLNQNLESIRKSVRGKQVRGYEYFSIATHTPF